MVSGLSVLIGVLLNCLEHMMLAYYWLVKCRNKISQSRMYQIVLWLLHYDTLQAWLVTYIGPKLFKPRMDT